MKTFARLCVCGLLAIAAVSHPALAQTDGATSIKRLKTYRFGDDAAVLDTVTQWVNESRPDAARRREAARALAEVLRSGASFDAKQFACRELVLIAGEEQVPALAALLQDEALAHYALLALARIPGNAVNEALRRELPRSRGRAQIEIIDALGERGDAEAIALLADQLEAIQLEGFDPATAEAAAAALGKMGDARAVPPLRRAYERATPTEQRLLYGRALLDCAERLRVAGDAPSAIAVYMLLQRDPASAELSAAVLRGMVRAGGEKALPQLMDALGKDGSPLQRMAMGLAREMPGRDVTRRLSARLPKLSAAGQLLLLAALRDRGDAAAVPAVTALTGSSNSAVQRAAVDTLGVTGDASTVPILLRMAATGPSPQRAVARAGIARLRGRAVDAKLLAMLNTAVSPLRVEIIGSLGQRRVAAAVPRLAREVRSRQPGVSAAAVRVLREMGQPSDLPALLAILPATAPNERIAVRNAVTEIARRGADEKQRTGAILTRLATTSNPDARVELLTMLGQIGGATALQTLRKAASDAAPQVRQSALRSLAEWPTDEPMNELLRVARTAPDENQRTLALRGAMRMIGLDKERSPQEALTLYRQAIALSQGSEAKRLALAGVSRLGSLAALEYASAFLADSEVRAEAEFAVVEISRSTIGAWRDRTRLALGPIAGGSVNQSARQRAREVLALSDRFGDFVTAWEVSPAYGREGADYSKLFEMSFPPEDPARAKHVAWRLMPAGANAEQPWLLDLLALWGGEQRVAYLRTAVWSETAREVVLELGSDDGVKAWWNGQVTFANNAQRAVAPGQDKVNLQVKPGWNHLLLKVTQNVMGWGACARFANADGSPATGLRYAVGQAG